MDAAASPEGIGDVRPDEIEIVRKDDKRPAIAAWVPSGPLGGAHGNRALCALDIAKGPAREC
jgi:hypothetical protein